ncbi:hypothetical protein [Streptomyces sp. SID13031]|uniref:hypothetical protein n=1 Tax=Streptomyces sp. SID13031 TaxID=2706046 RepID=UPI0013CC1174|nr:hypothetical protein [Streptomyces sp. SID13031]NEA32461.1 hypothetical protein [Streptomyces sp. SID13031]
MTRIDELAVLKTLDPAGGDVDLYCPRALTDLERILATDPALPTVPPRKSRTKRYVLAAGLVAATTTAALVVPSLLGGDQAFASWTATPTPLSAKESATASDLCRTKLFAAVAGAPDPDRGRLPTATTVIAERRGSTTLVVLTGPGGFAAECLNDRSIPKDGGFGGSYGSVAAAERPGRRMLSLTNFGTSSIDGKYVSMAMGYAGADVIAVTYRSPSRGKVNGTVAGGQFALWLPGKDLKHADEVGVPLQVTYRDGSTVSITLKP